MGELWKLITGDLGPDARVISSVIPALIPLLWLIGGVIAYSVRVKLKGPYHDPELENRETSPMLGLWLRRGTAWALSPIWRLVRATALPPSALTVLSVLMSVGAGVAVAAGRFALGGWIFLFAGVFDLLDGRLARATGTASPRGAILDSVLDRVSDAAILIGLAWYYRGTWVLMPTLVAMASSHLVSYIRARGEGLGFSVKGGWLGRPERVVILGVTVALSPALAALRAPSDPHPMHWVAVVGILVVAVGATLTALQRFMRLVSAMDDAGSSGPKRPRAMGAGKGSAFRTGVSSTVATLSDAATVVVLASTFGVSPWAATFVGCLVGAAVNFTIGRLWAFDGAGSPKLPQGWRYGLVWAGSTALNTGGVGLFMLLPGFDYRVAWILVRAVVFFGWNYPLQRDYVFTQAGGSAHVA